MIELLLLCTVQLWSTLCCEPGSVVGKITPALNSCKVVESEDEAAWAVYKEHYYNYPRVDGISLYRLDTLTMTLTKIPLKTIEVKKP